MTNPSRIAKGMYWDRAWSLVSGCTHVSPGCDNCWSAKETHMRANNPNAKVKARNEGLTDKGCFNGTVRLNWEFIGLPLQIKKPIVFAVWNDLFHEDVPDEFIARVWWVMGQSAGYLDPSRYRGHTFLILTKRPNRMREWLKGWTDQETRKRWIESFGELYDWMSGPKYWPNVLDDVWLGITAENQPAADERIPLLLQTPAAVRFISCEPLLGPVVLRKKATCDSEILQAALRDRMDEYSRPVERGIDWVVCGGESGSGARPMHPDWARGLRDQCQAAGVPFFFKQWGEWVEPYQAQIPPEAYEKAEHINVLSKHHSQGVPNIQLRRVGKKKAGRLLDGREWNEFPKNS